MPRVPPDRRVGRLPIVSHDLIVTVGIGFPSDAGEAGESDLSGADDPNRFSALTPDSSGVGVHGVTKAPYQIGAISAWIGSQVEFHILFQRDRCESGPSHRLLQFSPMIRSP